MKFRVLLSAIVAALLLFASAIYSQSAQTGSFGSAETDAAIPKTDYLQPQKLAEMLREPGPKPLILQVGSRVLFEEAHITGAEYAGPAGSTQGMNLLGHRVAQLPKDTRIVLYCGCCPWERCPNIRPAYNTLREMGFMRVKVLYLAENFGTNWADQGFPTESAR